MRREALDYLPCPNLRNFAKTIDKAYNLQGQFAANPEKIDQTAHRFMAVLR